jgi:hypothetical protein
MSRELKLMLKAKKFRNRDKALKKKVIQQSNLRSKSKGEIFTKISKRMYVEFGIWIHSVMSSIEITISF